MKNGVGLDEVSLEGLLYGFGGKGEKRVQCQLRTESNGGNLTLGIKRKGSSHPHLL